MAIGIWGKPAQLDIQPYDKDFMLNAAKAVQGRADDVEEGAYKLQSLISQVNAIDEHKEFKQELDNKYYQRLQNVYDRFNKGDIQGAKKELIKTSMDWQIDPLRNELENSYANKSLWQKDRIQKGEKYAPWEDPMSTFKGKTLDNQPEPFRYYGMGEIQDHQKRADEMMKIPHGSGYEKAGIHIDDDGNIIKIDKGYEGIAENFISQLAKAKTSDFLTTKEGIGFAKQSMYNGIPKENLGEYASQYLAHAGLGQMYKKITEKTDFQYAPEDVRTANTPIDVSTLSNPLRKHKVTANMSLEDMDNVEFDESGNVKPAKTQKIVGTPGTSRSPSGIDRVDVDIPREEVNTYIKTLQDKYPVLKNMPPKEAFEIIKDATKSLESSNATILKPGRAALQAAKYEIFGEAGYGDLHERTFYAINSKGEKSELNYKSVAKMLGYGDAIPDKALKVAAVTGVDVSGEDAGDYTVTIPASDGTATTLMVSSNDQIKRVAQLSGIVNNLVYMGGGTSVMKDNKGNITYKITVTNNLDPDSRTFDPKVTIEDANGNKDADLSLQDIHLMTATQVANKITPKKHK